ncbi:uncharacterized protein LOC129307494 [Prosopis cineraria]|uniref:uncharacterized protein LOC129307494 n=1 Tax=Prosopis cineraria TaxID=364024 RepID=UPI002410A0FD|nr:uncharacterized protein LOC129307494 [Prosopis cineraria]XP_054804449.1 uncharacterized protein LOC129307494 [Prosopis cineraria]
MDRKPTDVSRFMLFEATGDSEADGDAIMDDQSDGADGDDDDDDAESFSYEGSESHNWDLVDQQLRGHTPCVADAECEHPDGKKNDEEEADVHGTSYCDDDEIQKHQHRSSLSVDSAQQLMDEMEKNRRFWEACLAS